jgi:flagellar basal-body rod modification protein FlgD
MEVGNITADQYWGNKPAQPKSGLDMNQFLRLLAVQMENQNPLEPMSDRDFFAQMAQLGQVQGLDQVNKSLGVSQAAALMGKEVTAVRPMTDTSSGLTEVVTGRVVQLTVRNGEQYLGIKEANGGIVDVKASAIQQVRESE